MAPRLRVLLPVLALLAAPAALGGAPVVEDDAGSGQDAPDARSDEVVVEPGRYYSGFLRGGTPAGGLPTDREDWYAFEVTGAPVEARFSLLSPFFQCPTVTRPDGATVPGPCEIGIAGEATRSVTLTTDGTHHLRVGPATVPYYYEFWFSLGADQFYFGDDQYHEIILFDWDTTQIDVLVVPPAAAVPTARLDAVRRSIDAWEAGIHALAEPWLAEALDIRAYTAGLDVPPADALADPEVLVVSAEITPYVLFGIGASRDFFCEALLGDEPLAPVAVGPDGRFPPPWHQHPGSPSAVATFRCDDGENVCVVANSNMANSNSHRRMYDLNAHEFGHCLGIGHVGDALDFEAETYPAQDIMSYQHTPAQVHCVSNLNVRAVEGTFARVLGRPATEWLDGGDFVHMDPADYVQVPCANP